MQAYQNEALCHPRETFSLIEGRESSKRTRQDGWGLKWPLSFDPSGL
jgi:hypothetical protein